MVAPARPARRLSELHPLLYTLAVWVKRTQRHVEGYLGEERWCSRYEATPLPFRVKRHSSRLIKQLGESEMWLQHNKVRNLAIAIPRVTDVLLLPGETFSFCRLVGRPTRRKGYVEGMELSQGRLRPGVGGGLCQLSNMIHWLALHSPLSVIERSNHSFDPFPDHNRSIPFGTGAAIFYNYVDLRLRNETHHTFQLRFWLTDKELWGELRSNTELEHTYSVFERNHRFEQQGTDWYRQNEIWRRVMLRRGGATVREELLKENRARVLYTPPPPNEPEQSQTGG